MRNRGEEVVWIIEILKTLIGNAWRK